MIWVNADDFGLSHDVNLAIVEAFEKGYINRTTIMTNMPGFEEAVILAKEHGFFDRVGLHFNIFEGKPLSDSFLPDHIFGSDDGDTMTSYNIFHKLSKIRYVILPRSTKKKIKKECKAQIEKYVAAGFTAMHFDSHGHSHTIPSIYFLIRSTMRKYGFISCRKSLNLFSHRTSFVVSIFKKVINWFIKHDFKTSDYFSDLEDYVSAQSKDKSNVYEIMVHPGYDENGKLINLGHELPLSIITEKIVKLDQLF